MKRARNLAILAVTGAVLVVGADPWALLMRAKARYSTDVGVRILAIGRLDLERPGSLYYEFWRGLRDTSPEMRYVSASALARRGELAGCRALALFPAGVKWDGEARLLSLIAGVPPRDQEEALSEWFDKVAPRLRFVRFGAWEYEAP